MKTSIHTLHFVGLFLFVFMTEKTNATNYFWVNGSGNWTDFSNHWATSSGGSTFSAHVPYPTDNAHFDANSFSTVGDTVFIDQTIVTCADMDWTGVKFNPTLASPSGNTTNKIQIYGSLTFVSGMKLSFAGPISFEATTPNKTITSAGRTFNNDISFNGIGGGWTLADSLTGTFPKNGYAFAMILYLNAGSLNTNNQKINAHRFESITSTPRSLDLGYSIVNLTGCVWPCAWEVAGTGLVINAGNSTINCISGEGGFDGGGFIYNNVNFTATPASISICVGNGGYIQACQSGKGSIFNNVFFAGTGSIHDNNKFHDVVFTGTGYINDNCTFNNVFFKDSAVIANNNIFNSCTISKNGRITGSNNFGSLTFSPGFYYTLTNGKTQTILNALNVTGNGSYPIRIQSSTVGIPSTFFKASGIICADFLLLSDNIATGGATFNAGVNSADLGGNSGWNFPGVCTSTPVASFQSSETIFCAESMNCINFFDNSTGNPTSWQWTFNGGMPNSSTDKNPTNICYTTPGTYAVTLVVTNAMGSNTLNVSPMISVGGTPPIPTITIVGLDTLISSHASFYQWYYNGQLIGGATDSFYVAVQQGTYAVQITDSFGCRRLSNGILISVNELSAASRIKIYPNPATSSFTLQLSTQLKDAEVIIYDILGKEMMRKQMNGDRIEIEKGSLESGVYFVRVMDNEREYVQKIIVE